MNRQIKGLISKLQCDPPKGYAAKTTALGVSTKTFQWLEDLDAMSSRLDNLLWRDQAIPSYCAVKVADALRNTLKNLSAIRTWCQPACSEVEFKLFHCYGRLTNFLEDAEHLVDFIDAYLGPTLEELIDVTECDETKENIPIVEEYLDYDLCAKVNCIRHVVKASQTEYEQGRLKEWLEKDIHEKPGQRLYILNLVFTSLMKGVLGIDDDIAVFPDDIAELLDVEVDVTGKSVKRREMAFFVRREVAKVVLHLVECFKNGISTTSLFRTIDVYDLCKACLWLVFADVNPTTDSRPPVISAEECGDIFQNLLAIVRVGISEKETINDALMLLNLVGPYAASRMVGPSSEAASSPHAVLPKSLLINVVIAAFNRIKQVLSRGLLLSKSINAYAGIFPPIELLLGGADIQEHLAFFVSWVHNILVVLRWPKDVGDIFTYLLCGGGSKYINLLRLALIISFAGIFTESEESKGHEAALAVLPIAARNNLLQSNVLFWLDVSLLFGLVWRKQCLLDIDVTSGELDCSSDDSSGSADSIDIEAIQRVHLQRQTRLSIFFVANVFGAINRCVEKESVQTASLSACLGLSPQLPPMERDSHTFSDFIRLSKLKSLDRVGLLCLLQRPDATNEERAGGIIRFINSCSPFF